MLRYGPLLPNKLYEAGLRVINVASPWRLQSTLRVIDLRQRELSTTLSLNATAFAQKTKTDLGKAEFELHCAVCHGMDAKGNGFLGASLKVVPPDLTVLARNNGGVFPAERISGVIDGRAQIATHGPRDMPIWGTRYAVNAAEHFFDAPYDQEAYIRARILLLVDYLGRIQQK